MRVFDSSPTHWGIDEYDLANQGLISHHFEPSTGGSSATRCRSGTHGPQSST